MKPANLLIASMVLAALAVGLLMTRTRLLGEPTVEVFKATEDVPAGRTLAERARRTAIPRSAWESMKSEVPGAELENWVMSTPLVRDVKAGETITFATFQKSADPGLAIARGMRAVGIEVGGAESAGFLVRPGDHVDVLATLPEGRQMVTRYLLQAKRVLAVGRQYRLDDSAFPASDTYSTVTLEVSPAEAEKLEYARPLVQGRGFMLALRGKGDLALVQTPGVVAPSSELNAVGN